MFFQALKECQVTSLTLKWHFYIPYELKPPFFMDYYKEIDIRCQG